MKRFEKPRLRLENISIYCLRMLMKTFRWFIIAKGKNLNFLKSRIQRMVFWNKCRLPDFPLERCNRSSKWQREIQKSFNPPFFQYVDYTFGDLFFSCILFVSVWFCVIQLGMLLLNATSGQQAFCKHAVYDHRGMFFSLNSIMFCRKQTVKLSLDTLRGMQMTVAFVHLRFDWTIMSIHEHLECCASLSESDKIMTLMLIMQKYIMSF